MMLVKFSRFALIIISVFVLSVYLPAFFWKVFHDPQNPPFIKYSPVIDEFVILRATPEGLRYYDSAQNDYNQQEYDRLLPLLSARQLMFEGKFPDSLRGIKLNPDEVRINNIRFFIAPYSLDCNEIPVYPLFESQSGRVRLEIPDNFFRITDRMEFITASTNTINHELTDLFTRELVSRGFSFPSKIIAGNPTTRKPFDEGYFLVDARDKVFHCKMVQGKPFLAKLSLPDSLKIAYIAVSEMTLKEFYGILITRDNHCYLISYDNYRLIELPLMSYQRSRDRLRIYGDLFFRTVNVYADTAVLSLATDRNYQTISTYRESWKGKYAGKAGAFNQFIFPFSVDLKNSDSGYIGFIIRPPSLRSIWGMLLFSIIFIFLLIMRKNSVRKNWIDFLLVLITGIYGFIAVLAIKPVNNISS